MLKFSEVKVIAYVPPPLKRFKTWYEVLIDLMLTGAFIVMLLSWTCIINTESSGLMCVPLDGDIADLSIIDGRYMSSRCLLESSSRFVLFYPYFMLLQWVLIGVCHSMWHQIPRVSSKLKSYHEIFTRLEEVKPQFGKSSSIMVPMVIEDIESNEMVKLVQDKFTFLMTENSFITNIYITKNILNIVLVVVFTAISSCWFYVILKHRMDFGCYLRGGPNLKEIHGVACNVSPSYYLLGSIFLFQTILLIILLFSLLSFCLLVKITKYQSRVQDFFGGDADRFFGMPGFRDFVLFVVMHKTNVKDGGFFMQMVKLVIQARGGGTRTNEGDVGSISKGNMNVFSSRRSRFEEMLFIANEIGLKLGLELEIRSYEKNHLFLCLESLAKTVVSSFDVGGSLRKRIIGEIERNPFYYTYLLTGEIDSGRDEEFGALYKFEEYLKNLKNGRVWLNNIVVAAAANILRLRIIVLKVSNCGESYTAGKVDVFEPYSTGWSGISAIISFIPPYYYNLLAPVANSSKEAEANRRAFVSNSDYRHRVITKARDDVIKRLAHIHEPKHRKHASNEQLCPSNLAQGENALSGVDAVMSLVQGDGLAAARLRLLTKPHFQDDPERKNDKTISLGQSVPMIMFSREGERNLMVPKQL